MTERGHTFIRLRRWEQVRSHAAGGSFHLNSTPQPWARTGPGVAKDGKPRFDLEPTGEPDPETGVTPFELASPWPTEPAVLYLAPSPDGLDDT